MSTNFFFNTHEQFEDQLLLEELIIESISMFGQDMYYIPRTINDYDKVYETDDQSSYDRAIEIEMYIKNINGFKGDKSFFSKFAGGLQINDQIILEVARRRFGEEVTALNSQPRPFEGDLIYFPMNKKCFQIKFVDNYEMFYQLGALQTWELTCELFEYSGENLNTGIPEIDILQTTFNFDEMSFAIMDTDGVYMLDTDNSFLELKDVDNIVPFDDKEQIDAEAQQIINFTIVDPYSEGAV